MSGTGLQIAGYLLQTLLGLYAFVVMLRFLLQLVRADFYNPISQFVVKATNPPLRPLRRLIPGIGGIDVAALLLALFLQMLMIFALTGLFGAPLLNPLLLIASAAISLLGILLQFYFFAILAMIIISWVAPGSHHPALLLLYQLTEPVMAPFRRLLPPMGGLDLSPIIVFIVINVLEIAVAGLARGIGLRGGLVPGI
jgi:YggT family protein